jgi:ABC-type phosphate transport system substrate-binding protein
MAVRADSRLGHLIDALASRQDDLVGEPAHGIPADSWLGQLVSALARTDDSAGEVPGLSVVPEAAANAGVRRAVQPTGMDVVTFGPQARASRVRGSKMAGRLAAAAAAVPVAAAAAVAICILMAHSLLHVTGPASVRSQSPSPRATVQVSPSLSASEPICAAGSLRLIGSTAFMPIAQAATDAYMHACPGAAITVTGGESAYGLTQVRDAVASGSSSAGSVIAMYDGLPSPASIPGLRPYPVGVLIFSVVAHTGLFPAENITTDELRNIFGKAGDHGVVAVWSPADSGTREAFTTDILGSNPGSPTKDYCPAPTGSAVSTSCTEGSTMDMLNFLNRTPNAIGYAEASLPLTGYPQVSVLSIDNVSPTAVNVLNGSYRFWTSEHLYAAQRPATLTTDFLDFLPHYIQSIAPSDFIACSDALKRLGTGC